MVGCLAAFLGTVLPISSLGAEARFRVLSAIESRAPDGFVLVIGEIVNDGDAAGSVRINVDLLDASERVIGATAGQTPVEVVGRGERAPFLVEFDPPPGYARHRTSGVAAGAIADQPSRPFTATVTNVYTDRYGDEHIVGQVRNDGAQAVEGVSLVLTLRNSAGVAFAIAFAQPLTDSRSTLAAGQTASYDAFRIGATGPATTTTILVQGQAPSGATPTTSPSTTSPSNSTTSTTSAPPPSTEDRATRLSGPDRIDTAVAISRGAFSDSSAGAVVIVRSDVAADALAATPLAVSLRAPLLLTNNGGLDHRTAAEMERVLPRGGIVTVLGGSQALGPAVEDAVRARGYSTVRHAGADRFATAVRVADAGLGNPGTIFLASGLTFADALVAGAAAASNGGAVILTAGSSMPKASDDYLRARPSSRRFAVGRDAVDAAPGATALAGATGAETSRAVAERFFPQPEAVGVASVATFPDGLAGGADAGRRRAPLLLTEPARLNGPVASYLRARAGSIRGAWLYGGTAAVSEATRTDLEEAIR